MKIAHILSLLLVASALSLSIGGYLLYAHSLVPPVLVETTMVAVIVLFILAYFVFNGNTIAINIATILGIVSLFIPFSTPAHIGVIEEIGTGGLIALLGALQILGFIVFPVIYILVRIGFRARIRAQASF
ncbi:MAG: hypothetical protein JRN20_03305 [Nitrososphaerota archaeon]|nr:hypothetical protein [Nitrososphaerota archaeon]